MMKKKFYQKTQLLTIILTLLTFQIFAQNVVSGTIKDSKSNSAVPGASIVIEGTTIGTTTDANGNFKLENARAFPWNITISSVGYSSAKKTISSTNASLNITLDEESGTLNEVIISASRKAEKMQDAPASVSVISSKQLQAASSAIDPVRELMNVPGVQIQQQSASRINIEMRGSASLFDTGVFPILDYRSLVGPGIGTFNSSAAGLSTIDLARIEVVRGPASALYGPGVSSGVVHFISKSPIDFPGTTVELIGGQLKTFGGTIRHATASKNKKFGFKINAQYKKGDEFTLDGTEGTTSPAGVFTSQLSKFKKQIVDPLVNSAGVIAAVQTGAPVIYTTADLDPDGDGNMMQNDWFSSSVNGTLEYRPLTDMKLVLSGGFNESSNVFYNSQGEGLTQGKEYWTQFRVQKSGFFAQMFYVNNDGGGANKPTFLYQTGNTTTIGRKQIEGQVQYNFGIKKFLNADITAGGDYRNAISDTQNKVYGRNENDDAFTILGAYVQAKFELAKKLDLVLAGRYDNFNFLDKGAFSPRAALVFKANPNHSFRASYNKSFTPPTALNLNIDFPVATPVAGLFDVWLRGNKTPQSFSSTPMIDLTVPGFPDLPYGTPGLPLAIPYGAVTPAVLTGLAAALPANILPIVQSILTKFVPTGTSGKFTGYNLFTGQPLAPITAPIAQLQEQNTIEIGYKGTFNKKLVVTADVYKINAKGFLNFTAISPTISYTGQTIAADLRTQVGNAVTTQLEAALLASGMAAATAKATAASIGTAVGGAYNTAGTAFANQIAPLSSIFGAVETDGVPQDGMVHNAAGYRTFGNNSYSGVDLGLTYLVNNDFSIFMNYSTVSKNIFTEEDLGEAPGSGLKYYLNTPKNKIRLGASYAPDFGFRGNLSFQHDDSFYANYGQFTGDTDVKNLIDAGVGYKLKSGLSIDLTCTNLFDAQYRAFVNMPIIGRRAVAKLTYTFGGKKK